MIYTVIGTPRVQTALSDQWETTMTIDLRREDGATGEVWIVAGVPDYHRGSAEAARTQSGYQTVQVFGDTPDTWCPAPNWRETMAEIVDACYSVAMAVHQARMAEMAEMAETRAEEGGDIDDGDTQSSVLAS